MQSFKGPIICLRTFRVYHMMVHLFLLSASLEYQSFMTTRSNTCLRNLWKMTEYDTLSGLHFKELFKLSFNLVGFFFLMLYQSALSV